MRALFEGIAAEIARATGAPFAPRDTRAVAGGDISASFALGDGARQFFVKLQSTDRASMFEAEAQGLAALAAAAAVRVPGFVWRGEIDGRACLVLEHLSLKGHGDAAGLGRQLARQHRVTASKFGADADNWIGSTPQPNGWRTGWIDFWRDQRLGFQLRLAARNGYTGRLQQSGERLLAGLDAFFDGYAPQASLLHGDLWGGNHGYLGDGTPVVFDPAVYHGDRECDLAMTELFGGFASAFYAAYREAWPLDAGYETRRTLYNLYHILNHANLFGGGYASQAERMAAELLSHIR